MDISMSNMDWNKFELVWEGYKQELFRVIASQPSGKRIGSALPINIKHSGYFALIPENLDLNAHLVQYPLTNYKFINDHGHIKTVTTSGTLGAYFDIERLIYIIGLISSIPSIKKDSIDEEGYVSINAKYLRHFFKDYLSYLDYLIKTGILITDNQYIKDEKSKGYKFDPAYDSVPLVKYVYQSVREQAVQVEAVPQEVFNEFLGKFTSNRLLEHPYLSHWYEQKLLTINADLARQYAYQMMADKFRGGYESWDSNKDRWCRSRNAFCKKYPKSQYNAAIQNIESITSCDYKAKIDTNVHRLHSVITNIQKDYRNFLLYNEQPLVGIDIANSQPYLLCLLFNPLFWEQDSNATLNIGTLPTNIQSLFPQEHLVEIKDYVSSLAVEALQEYKQITSEGRVYEHIMSLINSRRNTTLDKKNVKTMMLIVFFSKNRYYHQQGAILKRLFDNTYPEIYSLIALTKRGNHAALACLLQSIESEIILHRCCKRIWEEGNRQVPVFTIHDSIATTTEHVEWVKGIMQEELTNAIGILPTLKEEQWNLSQVGHPQYLH